MSNIARLMIIPPLAAANEWVPDQQLTDLFERERLEQQSAVVGGWQQRDGEPEDSDETFVFGQSPTELVRVLLLSDSCVFLAEHGLKTHTLYPPAWPGQPHSKPNSLA